MKTYINDENFLLTLKTSGKSKSIDDFNIYEEYYERFSEKPSILKIVKNDFDFFDIVKIRDYIKKEFPNSKILFKDENYSIKYEKFISKKELWILDNGYFLLLEIDCADLFFNNPKHDIDLDNHHEISDYNVGIIPNDNSKYYNKEILYKIINIFEKSIIVEKKRTTIGIVAVDNGELYVKDFSINNNFKLKYMNLHYGDEFENFNKKLVKRLKNDKKGLILLHGEPGTGKTHYIRYLLSRITKNNKSILYFPPAMVEAIIDPNFINFINSWVNDNEKNCIILIEDAEPLLINRDNERNPGIINLLNLTDGLLSDVFGIQIIATFNTSLNNLDKALLRPERLIARKEFKPLSKERCIELADKIKIDKDKIKDKMTLADIYSIKRKNEIILHDIDNKTNEIGFKNKK